MVSETAIRLRTETRDEHQRLEDSLDIFDTVTRPDDRRRLVERFHGLHVGTERALAPLLSALDGLDYDARSRLPVLASDLADLGVDVAGLAVCAPRAPSSVAEALGLFYVTEGSTLGGHVIRKRLTARGDTDRGLGFLDPYGDQVGVRWRDFLAVLERETPSAQDRDDAVRGARAGFALTQAWLCAPVAA